MVERREALSAGIGGAGDGLQRPGATALRCEVFPLAWFGGRAVQLRRLAAGGGGSPGWRVAPPPGADPSRVTREELAAALGGLFEPTSVLLHSTSWRFEPVHLTLVLTYLAILDGAQGLQVPPAGFEAEPLTDLASPVADGDRGAIEPADALAHGLRHFALLRISDPAIAAALPAEWHRFLAAWHPLPAGLLHHYDELRPALTPIPGDFSDALMSSLGHP